MSKKFCNIGASIAALVFVPLFVVILFVQFAPVQLSKLILSPEKFMKIAKHHQTKLQEKAVKNTSKAIEKDLKSKDGNLLNNSFDPVIGVKKGVEGVVTIVEYLDYRCGYCKKAHVELEKTLKKYKGKVRLIIKNYPVIGGETSLYAAEVATAFFQKYPNKFAELHSKLFNANLKSPADVDMILKTFGVKYENIKDDKVRASIIRNLQFAKSSLNISGTPAFIIEGELLGGYVTSDQLSQIIEKHIK